MVLWSITSTMILSDTCVCVCVYMFWWCMDKHRPCPAQHRFLRWQGEESHWDFFIYISFFKDSNFWLNTVHPCKKSWLMNTDVLISTATGMSHNERLDRSWKCQSQKVSRDGESEERKREGGWKGWLGWVQGHGEVRWPRGVGDAGEESWMAWWAQRVRHSDDYRTQGRAGSGVPPPSPCTLLHHFKLPSTYFLQ